MEGLRRRLILRAAAPLLLAAAILFPKDAGTVYLPNDVWAVLTPEMEIEVLAKPLRGEGWAKIAARLGKDPSKWRDLKKMNGDRDKVFKGRTIRIPFEWLRPDLKYAVFKGFFLEDRYQADGWHHILGTESLWHTALWFTGSGKNYRKIREFNNLPTLEVAPGMEIVIPKAILWKDIRLKIRPEKAPPKRAQPLPLQPAPSPQPPAPMPSPVPPPASNPQPPAPDEDLAPGRSFLQVLALQGAGLQLQFEGDYAVYRLKKGEAIYSAVVIRFTGAEEAEEVLRTAREIAKLSGVEDVAKIPAGYPLKIPKDLLLPQYLPRTSHEHIEWERQEKAVEAVKVDVFAPKLEGVHVVLDAGHGGKDTGAVAGGVWESTYVYDIYARIHNLLKETTQALVYTLVMDQKSLFTITPSDRLPQHRRQFILTTPPQALGDPQTGVNLRWRLANLKMAELKRQAVDPHNVVFISIHADALHRSIRGTTVYIPGARYCKGIEGQNAVQAEGYSRGLADEIIDNLYKNGFPIHPYQPVRNRIIRYRSYWVPAVLKMNHVPTKVLIEVANLDNPEDRLALQTQAFRQKYALSVVEALVAYYSRQNGQSGPRQASMPVRKDGAGTPKAGTRPGGALPAQRLR